MFYLGIENVALKKCINYNPNTRENLIHSITTEIQVKPIRIPLYQLIYLKAHVRK
jgi:hypothetical protein